MAIARRLLVPEGVSRCYHCMSRCVRRASLCDGKRAHRKDWIKDRLIALAKIFGIEVGGFAIMGNHLHLLVRTRPDLVDEWSDEEVVRRWLKLYPRLAQTMQEAAGRRISRRQIVETLAADRDRVKTWRQRLGSLSWFMKCLKEPIARRANREDEVTGHFWEGRFKVQSLLDEGAVLACLAYIDLNPIRAGIATTPERSHYTSVQERIRARRRRRRRRIEGNIWLIPIERRAARGQERQREGLTSLTLDEYLQLVDRTGRQRRPGKTGSIPAALAPILSRLELDAERWLKAMIDPDPPVGTAIGSASNLAAEAVRRGTRWVVNACRVYTQRELAAD